MSRATREPASSRYTTILVHLVRIEHLNELLSSELAGYHGNRAMRLPWVMVVGAEVAGLQATDLIDALVQSCTGGRTESLTTRRHSIWRELLPGPCRHRRIACPSAG